jgi:hypothetical protein
MKLNTKSLKDIETGFPVISAGSYFCKTRKKAIEPNKKQTGHNLVIQVQVLDDKLVTADGKQIDNRGQVVLTRWIGLVASDNYDPNVSIKELALAAGRDQKSEDDFNVEDIADYMKVTIAVRAAGPDKDGIHREAANEIKRFAPIKPEDKFTPPAI